MTDCIYYVNVKGLTESAATDLMKKHREEFIKAFPDRAVLIVPVTEGPTKIERID